MKDLLDLAKTPGSAGEQGLGLNVAFVFEGEEENGSIGTEEALRQNIHWFENTALSVISNTQWVGEIAPCLTYGMRGMISMDVEVLNNKNLFSVCNAVFSKSLIGFLCTATPFFLSLLSMFV